MKLKMTNEQLKKLLRSYGAKPENWPSQYRRALSVNTNSLNDTVKDAFKNDLKNELEAESSVDLFLEKTNQLAQANYTPTQLDQMSNAVLAKIKMEIEIEVEAKIANSLPTKLFSQLSERFAQHLAKLNFLSPTRIGLASIIVLSATILISTFIYKPPEKPQNQTLASTNSAIVEQWLWSEVNSELLDFKTISSNENGFAESEMSQEEI